MGEMLTSKHFHFRDASAHINYVTRTKANLNSVLSRNPGYGDASGLIQLICAFADGTNLTLELMVQRYHYKDGRGMNNRQLRDFYAKYGFVSDPIYPYLMQRKPGQGEHTDGWRTPEHDPQVDQRVDEEAGRVPC